MGMDELGWIAETSEVPQDLGDNAFNLQGRSPSVGRARNSSCCHNHMVVDIRVHAHDSPCPSNNELPRDPR